jgi:hypothetical protein
MAFYGKLILVEEFIHRGHVAKVYRTMRGAIHCRLDHEVSARKCQACGKPVEPVRVYVIYVENKPLGIDCEKKEEALELARLWIDDMINDPDDDDDEDGDREDAENGPNKPPKERDAKAPTGGKGAKKKLVKSIKQLGWGRRALAMIQKGGGTKTA